MPFRVEPLDIVFIIAVALLIFGPTQLPAIGRGIGRALSEFRHGAKEMAEGFKEEVTAPSRPNPVTPPPSAPAPGVQVSCPACGKLNSQEAQFCRHCGAQLSSVQNDS